MQKKLISKNDIEKMNIAERTVFYVEKYMILSPGAKDYLRKKEVKLDYTTYIPSEKQEETLGESETLEEIIKRILYKDYGVEDEHIVSIILKKIKN